MLSFFMLQERGVRGSVASLACAGAVILGLRLHIMGLTPPVFATSDNPAARSPSIVTRGLTFAFLPALNAWSLAYPRWLSFDWSMDAVPRIETLSDVRNAASVALYVGLALCVKKWSKSGEQMVVHTSACKAANNNNLVRCRCPNRLSKAQAALFSLALLVLPFIPASNLFFYVGFVMAERVLYLPSVGYCFLVGLGYSSLCRVLGVKFTKTLMGLLLFTFATRTYLRNFDWLDDESLYRSGIDINPPKGKKLIILNCYFYYFLIQIML